jgi:hypothetical protein
VLETSWSFFARKLIWRWLQAGYVRKGPWHQTNAGMLQGTIMGTLQMTTTIPPFYDFHLPPYLSFLPRTAMELTLSLIPSLREESLSPT